MRIINVKKFIRSIGIVLGIIFILSLICAKGSFSHKETEYEEFYVSAGDTLWTIASNLQTSNDYYKNKDIRYIITDIQSINNLESSNLYVGQELVIPII